MKRTLIVGGNGFIGSAIADYLVDLNCPVGIYDLIPSNRESVESYSGDVINDSRLVSILSNYDVVIYLLSSIMPKASMEKPIDTYVSDIPLMITLLDACQSAGIKRVVFSSSGGAIYGEQTTPNMEDVTIPNPINHYAICKLACEKILMLYNSLYGMENIILRISNPFGINQNTKSGVGAVSTFARRIMDNQIIEVYGNGENVRDFIPVKDVAYAFYKAIDFLYSSDVTPIFNVGSGKGISLNALIQIISECLDKNAALNYSAERSFDLRNSVLDMTKTRKYFGEICKEPIEKSIRDFCEELKQK